MNICQKLIFSICILISSQNILYAMEGSNHIYNIGQMREKNNQKALNQFIELKGVQYNCKLGILEKYTTIAKKREIGVFRIAESKPTKSFLTHPWICFQKAILGYTIKKWQKACNWQKIRGYNNKKGELKIDDNLKKENPQLVDTIQELYDKANISERITVNVKEGITSHDIFSKHWPHNLQETFNQEVREPNCKEAAAKNDYKPATGECALTIDPLIKPETQNYYIASTFAKIEKGDWSRMQKLAYYKIIEGLCSGIIFGCGAYFGSSYISPEAARHTGLIGAAVGVTGLLAGILRANSRKKALKEEAELLCEEHTAKILGTFKGVKDAIAMEPHVVYTIDAVDIEGNKIEIQEIMAISKQSPQYPRKRINSPEKLHAFWDKLVLKNHYPSDGRINFSSIKLRE